MTENGAAAAKALLREFAEGTKGLGEVAPSGASGPWTDWGSVDDGVDVVTICQFLFLAAFAEGREPHAYMTSIRAFRRGEWRLPEGARVRREARTGQRAVYAAGEGWSLYIQRYYPATAW
jgi:hypothetical protein